MDPIDRLAHATWQHHLEVRHHGQDAELEYVPNGAGFSCATCLDGNPPYQFLFGYTERGLGIWDGPWQDDYMGNDNPYASPLFREFTGD